MAYTITLKIDGKNETFKRTDPPFLKEMTYAITLQSHELTRNSKETGPTDKQIKDSEKDTADFAVKFWNSQFSAQDVINGADMKAMEAITKALNDSLGNTDAEDEEAKK